MIPAVDPRDSSAEPESAALPTDSAELMTPTALLAANLLSVSAPPAVALVAQAVPSPRAVFAVEPPAMSAQAVCAAASTDGAELVLHTAVKRFQHMVIDLP